MSDTLLKPHRGPMILTFGILGLVVCMPLGIVAWVMGNSDLTEIRAGRMDPSGEQLTNAGRICGMIATILAVVGILIALLVLALGVGGAALSQQ